MRVSRYFDFSATTVIACLLSLAVVSGCNSEPANPPAANVAAEAPKAPEAAAPTNVSEATPANAPSATESATNDASTAAKSQPHPLDKVAPLIPRDVLFGNPDKAMALMSHDGKRLAYLAPLKFEDGADVLNVWVGPIDDPSAAKAVTHEKARPIEAYLDRKSVV